jgi:hypothetical protein
MQDRSFYDSNIEWSQKRAARLEAEREANHEALLLRERQASVGQTSVGPLLLSLSDAPGASENTFVGGVQRVTDTTEGAGAGQGVDGEHEHERFRARTDTWVKQKEERLTRLRRESVDKELSALHTTTKAIPKSKSLARYDYKGPISDYDAHIASGDARRGVMPSSTASRDELLGWLKRELKRRNVGASQLMSLMDNDRSGTATFNEFSGGLTAVNFDLTRDEYSRLYKAVDVNGDRSVSIEELRNNLYGAGGGPGGDGGIGDSGAGGGYDGFDFKPRILRSSVMMAHARETKEGEEADVCERLYQRAQLIRARHDARKDAVPVDTKTGRPLFQPKMTSKRRPRTGRIGTPSSEAKAGIDDTVNDVPRVDRRGNHVAMATRGKHHAIATTSSTKRNAPLPTGASVPDRDGAVRVLHTGSTSPAGPGGAGGAGVSASPTSASKMVVRTRRGTMLNFQPELNHHSMVLMRDGGTKGRRPLYEPPAPPPPPASSLSSHRNAGAGDGQALEHVVRGKHVVDRGGAELPGRSAGSIKHAFGDSTPGRDGAKHTKAPLRSEPSFDAFFQRSADRLETTAANFAARQRRIEADAMAECTFQPHISRRTRELTSKDGAGFQQSRFAGHSAGEAVEERLRRLQDHRDAQLEEARRAREQEIMGPCTFTPEVHASPGRDNPAALMVGDLDPDVDGDEDGGGGRGGYMSIHAKRSRLRQGNRNNQSEYRLEDDVESVMEEEAPVEEPFEALEDDSERPVVTLEQLARVIEAAWHYTLSSQDAVEPVRTASAVARVVMEEQEEDRGRGGGYGVGGEHGDGSSPAGADGGTEDDAIMAFVRARHNSYVVLHDELRQSPAEVRAAAVAAQKKKAGRRAPHSEWLEDKFGHRSVLLHYLQRKDREGDPDEWGAMGWGRGGRGESTGDDAPNDPALRTATAERRWTAAEMAQAKARAAELTSELSDVLDVYSDQLEMGRWDGASPRRGVAALPGGEEEENT